MKNVSTPLGLFIKNAKYGDVFFTDLPQTAIVSRAFSQNVKVRCQTLYANSRGGAVKLQKVTKLGKKAA